MDETLLKECKKENIPLTYRKCVSYEMGYSVDKAGLLEFITNSGDHDICVRKEDSCGDYPAECYLEYYVTVTRTEAELREELEKTKVYNKNRLVLLEKELAALKANL